MEQLQLIIPDPCHEDWNAMTPNDQGRLCNSCAKTVVDFSAMTDAQLMNYFARLQGENVCGRIHHDQLQRNIQSLPTPRKKIWGYWQYALTFILFFSKAKQSHAQGGLLPVRFAQNDIVKNFTKGDQPLSKFYPKQCKITDENGGAISNASIKFTATGSYAFADSLGYFSLAKHHPEDSILITAVGFKKSTLLVKDIVNGIITLEPAELLLDNVVVSTVSTSRCSVTAGGIGYRVVSTTIFKDTLQNIVNLFAPSISVYPNPAVRGSVINLLVKVKKAGRYAVYITDASGKLVWAQNYIAEEKKLAKQLPIPSQWAAGIYIITITDDKGKNTGKEKIMIR